MEDQSSNNLRTRVTFGERLSVDCNIDVVAPTAGGELELVVYSADKTKIVPKLEHDGTIYVPPKLHPTIRGAIRFPSRVTDCGEVQDLFLAVVQLVCTAVALPEAFAAVATAWIFAGWVPEYFMALPVLCVIGSNPAQAMKLFHLLRELCRRAIIVADLNLHLPTELGPTLLLVDADLSKRAQACWRACNHRGVYLPMPGGGLKGLACTKAIYSEIGTGDVSQLWGDEVLRVVLLPNNHIPMISVTDLAEIATEFQSKFQLFRLRRLQELAQAGKVSCPAAFARSTVTRELFALLGGESRASQLLLPVTEIVGDAVADRRAVDPMHVVVEVIWTPAHQQDAITISELQKRVNALLGARGETAELNVHEVGWKLRDLGLKRQRTAKGMVLKFSRDLRIRIHELARQFGLELPEPDSCPLRAPLQIVER